MVMNIEDVESRGRRKTDRTSYTVRNPLDFVSPLEIAGMRGVVASNTSKRYPGIASSWITTLIDFSRAHLWRD